MLSTDPHFLLALHHEHMDDLHAEAAADRLARLVRLATRRNRTKAVRSGRLDAAAARAPAVR
jgi:hypothetical protein